MKQYQRYELMWTLNWMQVYRLRNMYRQLFQHRTQYGRTGSIISCCAASNANCSMVHIPTLPWDQVLQNRRHHQLLYSNAAISGFVKSIIRFHAKVDTQQNWMLSFSYVLSKKLNFQGRKLHLLCAWQQTPPQQCLMFHRPQQERYTYSVFKKITCKWPLTSISETTDTDHSTWYCKKFI